MTALELGLWAAIATVIYAYVGYGAAIWLLSQVVSKPVRYSDELPHVTLLVAAFNEQDVIGKKIQNTLDLDYPVDRLEVLIVADGSSDGTCDAITAYADRGVKMLFQPERRGKNHAVNRAVQAASGSIIVSSDANAFFTRGTLKNLVRNFGDPQVARVAGEKRVASGDGTVGEAEGLYWRYESWLKVLDSRVSSVMGAAGEIFAIRKELFHAPPADAIIEDFMLSMGLVQQGWRVVYEPTAIAHEEASPNATEEFKRKVRIVAGGWQAVFRMWPLLTPAYGLVSFQYVSHRVLRWTVVPFLLPLIAALNLALVTQPVYAALLVCQVGFYGLAALGYALEKRGKTWKPAYLPFFFVFLNWAALCGAWRFVTKTQAVTWERVRRPATT
jgi:biofilm PGA synthesis N-glycosyltransferase PgaC